MNKDIIFEDLGYDPTEWDLLIERQRTLVAKHKKNPEILKVYFQDHWRDKLRRFLGEARADRYVAGEELIARTGLFTPEILGFGRARGLSYVKMQYIDGVELISVIQWLSENEYGQILNEILKQFGELVGILHKAGLVHGDLRAGNVLCKIQKNTIQQVLIDHDRSRKVGFKKHE